MCALQVYMLCKFTWNRLSAVDSENNSETSRRTTWNRLSAVDSDHCEMSRRTAAFMFTS